MKIAMHTAMALVPTRTPAVPRQPSSSPATAGPTKPTAHPTGPNASTDPFSSLFQKLSGGTATSGLATNTVSPTSIFGGGASVTTVAAAAANSSAAATSGSAAMAPAAAAAPAQSPGIGALVSAIMNGSFQPTYVTDPSQLQETTSVGTTDTMPNFYYASDATAKQLASLLGGTVVQRTAFGQDQGWSEPLANFIQLPNGQTFNAADIAYYARCGSQGSAQLTADLTGAINEGSAWTNYYTNGGSMPTFPTGYVGPPITGMAYPVSSIGGDGNVVNPALQGTNT
jgi:hypothetical protein